MDKLKALIEYIILGVIGVVLYYLSHTQATAWRGYEAVGGEALLLGLPLWVALVKVSVRDLVQIIEGDEKNSRSDAGTSGTARK